MVAEFVVLCGANIVGNIISAEKRCNYSGRSRVTRLVTYILAYEIVNVHVNGVNRYREKVAGTQCSEKPCLH